MKTIIVKLILLIVLIFSNTVSAQTIKKTIKEKSVQGTTYVLEQYGSEKVNIKNKNGKYEQFMKERGKDCESFAIQDQDASVFTVKKIAKNVFSDARIKQLSGDDTNNFGVLCICNQMGEIKAVEFIRVKTSAITLQEIKVLEDAFLKMKVNIYNRCPEVRYFKFTFPVRFKDYI